MEMTDTFDPYAILGVARGATAADIKNAYRRRARDTHPDIAKTTDASAFQAVARAFEILANPEKRKRFDETGTIEEINPLKDRNSAMEVLAGVFEGIVNSASQKGKKLSTVPFIDALKEIVEGNILEAHERLGDLTVQIEERVDLRRRISRAEDAPNIFADRLSAQIRVLGKAQDGERERLRILKLAEIELGNYTNEVELVFAFQAASYGFAAPSSSSTAFSVAKMWPT